jgi:hypothetical protein
LGWVGGARASWGSRSSSAAGVGGGHTTLGPLLKARYIEGRARQQPSALSPLGVMLGVSWAGSLGLVVALVALVASAGTDGRFSFDQGWDRRDGGFDFLNRIWLAAGPARKAGGRSLVNTLCDID